mmetsp:Transcript_14751/g.20279  ORF Transcript_14751/g.20279 Transcript_14751/m.20279 type:complete len:113 (+) Transcript_14751:82-420(+)
MANNIKTAILYDVFDDAQNVLIDANHPRGNVSSHTLRNNLRRVIIEDFYYSFTQYSVYSKDGQTLPQCVAEARAIKRMGPPAHAANGRRNLNWLLLHNPRPASIACAEIRIL